MTDIDRLIAERVMGFNDLYTLDNAWEGRFSPSTDAAHCRMVMDKFPVWTINKKGHYFVEVIIQRGRFKTQWMAGGNDKMPNIWKCFCIAALENVGVPEAEIRAALGEEG